MYKHYTLKVAVFTDTDCLWLCPSPLPMPIPLPDQLAKHYYGLQDCLS